MSAVSRTTGWVLPIVLLLTGCTTTTTDPPPQPPAVASSPAREPRRASVVMNGDLLWHNTLVAGAKDDAGTSARADELDFRPLLAGVRPVVESADLAICHNEVPVAPPGGPYRYYPAFRSPQQTLDAVKDTGYDMCTTASNHALDDGWEGLERTVTAMRTRQLLVAGTADTPQLADHPPILTTAGGVRIAVVAGTYDTNGIPRPPGREWSVGDLNADALLRKAATARADGADIVLVALHAGEEYAHTPNEQQRALAERLTASPDVDLVYGHHVHVVQPWTRVNGKWVIYGLGNLVAQHKAEVRAGYEGVTARLTFVESEPGRFRVDKAEYLPTLVTTYRPGRPARLFLVNQALTRGEGERARLEEARDRTRRVVTSLGGTEGLVES